MTGSLFTQGSTDRPLAEQRRPKKVRDIIGQSHILTDRFLQNLRSDRWSGFIFWGPPGTGKTTLAWAIASETSRPFHHISAVSTGVKEIREYLDRSMKDFQSGRPAHILFVDEFHRLNKAQQDVFLPYLELGGIRLIGATTENPSFEVNNAVASRCLVFHFNALTRPEMETIVQKAIPQSVSIDEEVIKKIAEVANGDARRALNILENLTIAGSTTITLEDFEKISHAQSLYYDKQSESHYDTISAYIKSVRGSDPSAAVYYLARMLEGGEDPLFIARRLIILASEDIGNADPRGLVLATACFQSVHVIGMPEARIILSQVTTYLACAPKSNRSYAAINAAIETVKQTGNLDIPLHIRNAPNKMMKEWGYGKDYQYPHDFEGGHVVENYLPESLRSNKFYQPSDCGEERKIAERMNLKNRTV